MKIRVAFKTPDVLDYALENFQEDQRQEIKNLLSRWIKWDECVTIEFDLEQMTAKVKEN